jgi:hypothetical protein
MNKFVLFTVLILSAILIAITVPPKKKIMNFAWLVVLG